MCIFIVNNWMFEWNDEMENGLDCNAMCEGERERESQVKPGREKSSNHEIHTLHSILHDYKTKCITAAAEWISDVTIST